MQREKTRPSAKSAVEDDGEAAPAFRGIDRARYPAGGKIG
jgi:hypothetical protein